jgi:hypothetical protein
MITPAKQFCPLCRGELRMADAVRIHLVADHKRSTIEADELIARFDTAKPIPEPEPEPHMYCAGGQLSSGGARNNCGAGAPRSLVH